jgi:predicted Zn-dependent protease
MLGLPSTALATTIAVQPQSVQGVAQIRLSLGELFQNVFRYIQVSTISDQEEVELGRQINQMVLSQQYQLYNNRQVQQYVDRVGQRLVAASDSRDIPFTFQVVASDEVNAFATPGGFVYVTTGLLQEADNEAQLASVLAHEIAHINERHSVQALRRAVLAQGIAETAGVEMNALAQVGYQVAFELPRSRDYEYAADAAGLQILQAAGYPPQAFVNFLEQLMDSSAQPEFLRTHPTGDSRIRELQSQYSSSANTPRQGTSTNAYQEAISPLY